MDLREADVLGDTVGDHWYYRSKAQAVERLLASAGGHSGPIKARAILDVGAGSGFFARHLLQTTGAHSACCVDTSYATEHDETVAGGHRLQFRREIATSDADLVLLMDVLEHVTDDLDLLSRYVRSSPPGAWFVISVPAFGWLWSGHDEFLGHQRRYTLPQLESVIAEAGLQLECGCYFFGLVLPLALPGRLYERLLRRPGPPRSALRRHPLWLDRTLAALCRLELPLMRDNRVAGLSVMCLARRPA